MKGPFSKLFLLLCLSFLSACGSRPVIQPNPELLKLDYAVPIAISPSAIYMGKNNVQFVRVLLSKKATGNGDQRAAIFFSNPSVAGHSSGATEIQVSKDAKSVLIPIQSRINGISFLRVQIQDISVRAQITVW